MSKKKKSKITPERARAVADIRWLAASRARYCHIDHDDAGAWHRAIEPERWVHTEHTAAEHVADMLEGSNDGFGWNPSWVWDDWAERALLARTRAKQAKQRRAEAEALRAEVSHWVADFVRLYPPPYGLPPNLTLATRALALLHAEGL